jgi:hypothetical protein
MPELFRCGKTQFRLADLLLSSIGGGVTEEAARSKSGAKRAFEIRVGLDGQAPSNTQIH